MGSRSATTYGGDVAAEIGAECAAEGWTVVSGAAFGIDVAAHRGALAAGGSDRGGARLRGRPGLPAGHEQLIEHIAAEGLVVSESMPGSAPFKGRFLTRNRLIVGADPWDRRRRGRAPQRRAQQRHVGARASTGR